MINYASEGDSNESWSFCNGVGKDSTEIESNREIVFSATTLVSRPGDNTSNQVCRKQSVPRTIYLRSEQGIPEFTKRNTIYLVTQSASFRGG